MLSCYTHCCDGHYLSHASFRRCKYFFCGCRQKESGRQLPETSACRPIPRPRSNSLQGGVRYRKDQEQLWINLTQVMRGNAKTWTPSLPRPELKKPRPGTLSSKMKFHKSNYHRNPIRSTEEVHPAFRGVLCQYVG